MKVQLLKINYFKYLAMVIHFLVSFILYQDIEECETSTSGCQQTCTNNVGSYNCGCNTGYNLNVDRKSCYGKYLHYNSNTMFNSSITNRILLRYIYTHIHVYGQNNT